MPKPLEGWKKRYQQAHEVWFAKEYPQAYKSGLYTRPKWPRVSKSNGLTTFVINFCNWLGHAANRINTQGQARIHKVPRFNIFQGKVVYFDKVMWTPGATRSGTADTDIVLKHPDHQYGIPIKAEIKVGADTQGPDQHDYEKFVTQAGAIYVIIRTPEQWLLLYDEVMAEN